MINKVVLDTNVLVSALLANGPPASIVDMIAEGRLIPFYNDLIITEYWNVLKRPKFGFHISQVNRLVDSIVRIGIAVDSKQESDIPMPHKDDRKFYDTAKVSFAILITGNIKHFPPEPFILTPADFLRAHQKTTLTE